jgi:protein involved in polysaccharide export with SLBB domain
MTKSALVCLLILSISLGPTTAIYAQGLFRDQRDIPKISFESPAESSGSMSVHVLGEVGRPGTYSVKPNDRLVKVFSIAGGINSQAAETRIELRRGNLKPIVLNLVQLNRNGALSNNPFLQENDVIFVPRKKAAAIIQGPIKYPGSYEVELDGTTTAKDLVENAGGYTVGLAGGTDIVVIRYDEANERKVFNLKNDEDELKSFKIKDGDTVQIPHKFTVKNTFSNTVDSLPADQFAIPSAVKEVFVLGGVKSPGKFPFNPQLSVGQYVSMSGGLSRLGREDLLIHRTDGTITPCSIGSTIPINPGDTIVVNEDKLGPEFWITFMTTLVTLSLQAYAFAR